MQTQKKRIDLCQPRIFSIIEIKILNERNLTCSRISNKFNVIERIYLKKKVTRNFAAIHCRRYIDKLQMQL